LNSGCGNDQISPATAQDSKVEFCHMYTCSNQKMMRYKRLESARPGSWGHLFDKIEEAEDICIQLQRRRWYHSTATTFPLLYLKRSKIG